MRTAGAAERTARVEARVNPEQKKLFQRAADLEGLTLSDFAVRALQAAAEESIQKHQMMRLTADETVSFVQAFSNPREPSEALREAARRHREILGER